MDRTGMTDKEIFNKCILYIDQLMLQVKIKLTGNTYTSEDRNDFIIDSFLKCKKFLEKTKESLTNKGKTVKDDIIIKELVKRSMFWKYIKKEEVMV